MTDVGPDPVKWIERLIDVNASSQFTDLQKAVIAGSLANALHALRKLANQ
jgi:hypothetical protein